MGLLQRIVGFKCSAGEAVKRLTGPCPQCEGNPVRLVGHGDRFNPAEYDECEAPFCVGGFMPSDVLRDATDFAFDTWDAAMNVLRLLDGEGQ